MYRTVDPRNGTVMEVESYREKGCKYPKRRQTCIGKMVDGRFMPNQHYIDREEKKELGEKVKELEKELAFRTRENKELSKAAGDASSRRKEGLTYVLNGLAEEEGILEAAGKTFGDAAPLVLSLCYYMISSQAGAMDDFTYYARTSSHPYGDDVSPAAISNLLKSITEEKTIEFFRCLSEGKRKGRDSFVAFDGTTISSYSGELDMCETSQGKRDPDLRHFAIAAAYSSSSGLCSYYRLYRGNIPDMKTIEDFAAVATAYGLPVVNVVMDRGYSSYENILTVKKCFKTDAITCLKKNTQLYRKAFDALAGTFESDYRNYIPSNEVYGSSQWLDVEVAEGESASLERFWLHLYYDRARAASEEIRLHAQVSDSIEQLNAKVRDGKIALRDAKEGRFEAKCKSLIKVRTLPGRKFAFEADMEKLEEARRKLGYFVLLSTKRMDASAALGLYRAKDGVERIFNTLKNDLGFTRAEVKTDETLQGKVFIAMVAGMLVQRMKNLIREHRDVLGRALTFNKARKELELMFTFSSDASKKRWCEISDKQAAIVEAMGLPLPVEKSKVVMKAKGKRGPKKKA